jgi:hypothetical protein
MIIPCVFFPLIPGSLEHRNFNMRQRGIAFYKFLSKSLTDVSGWDFKAWKHREVNLRLFLSDQASNNTCVISGAEHFQNDR